MGTQLAFDGTESGPLLIATDEAGYGPKLGPLVIAATAWRLPENLPLQEFGFAKRLAALAPLFHPLETPFRFTPDSPEIFVGDSKRIFKPGDKNGLSGLETVVHAALRWKDAAPIDSLSALLDALCPNDREALGRQPWFSDSLLSCRYPGCEAIRAITAACWEKLREHWRCTELVLVDVAVRIIDAASFNARCKRGFNKAEILSEATTQLVSDLLNRHPAADNHVYCDRHGGRRYYGGVLQHARPDARLVIEHESAGVSCYCQHEPTRTVAWQFTVKGDAFPPVSLASLVAKYLRERMMGCFNTFWQTHLSSAVRPTAGYPSDADRFLAEIEPTRRRLRIDHRILCRQR